MADPTAGSPLVELRGISKRYPGVVALDGVSLALNAGEIVALVGENGAGKSTLMKTLAGIVTPDEGEIVLDGAPVRLGSPARAAALGIALVHQELADLDNLDVAGNVYLGREPRRYGLLDRRTMVAETARILTRLRSRIPATAPLSDLSLAERQTVEIAKALSQGACVLILDEPTSSLTLSETEGLLALLRELRAEGVGIVYVSHRLGEVRAIADRAVALRDGRNAGELARESITSEAMVRLMVGRDIHRAERTVTPVDAPVRLRLESVRTRRYPKEAVTLEVRGGEILGIAGLVGAGRTELLDAIFGTVPRLSGRVTLDGADVPPTPKRAIAAGIGLVPEDRRRTGLLVEWPIAHNVTLPTLSRFSKSHLIPGAEETRLATKEANAIGVKAPNVEVAAATLSGGNQQKVVLAKWLLAGPKALLLDEPTRGVDVGAKAEIYAIMRGLAAQGVAVIMVSSDMEEILAESDRVAVLSEGRLTGILERSEATEENVMRLAVRDEAVLI